MAQAGRLATLLKQRASLIELIGEHKTLEEEAKGAIQDFEYEMMDIEQEVRTACIRQLSFPSLQTRSHTHTQLHALTVTPPSSLFSYSQVDGITGRTRDTTKCDIGMSTRRQASEISTRRPSTCGSTRDLTARSTARSSCSAAVMMARQSEQKTKSRTETLHAPSRARGVQRPVWRVQGAHPIWDAATPSALPRLYQAGATASECSSRVDPSPLRGVAFPRLALTNRRAAQLLPCGWSGGSYLVVTPQFLQGSPTGGRRQSIMGGGAHPRQQGGSRPL